MWCEFRCRECGRQEVWTEEQQKWYYEVAQGPLHATAIDCHQCGQQQTESKELQRQQMEQAKRETRKDCALVPQLFFSSCDNSSL